MQAPGILIVEDELIIATDIERMCLKKGYRVLATATTAQEALEMARALSPDLVLMDIVLRERGDGIETARLIRDERDVPFIFITAHSDEDTIARAKRSGSYGYLLKPVKAIELAVAIETALSRHEMEKKLRESEQRFSRLAANSPAIIYQYRIKPMTGFDYLSPAVALMTGYSTEEHYADPGLVLKLTHPDDRDMLIGIFNHVIPLSSPLQVRFMRRDGALIYTEHYLYPLHEPDGEYTGMEGIALDVTARTVAEERIRRLSDEIMSSQESERQRVARDLHDGIGQTILAAKLNFSTYMKNPRKYRDRFERGMQFIDKASEELREVYMDLYPSILRDLGLEAAVRWYAKNCLESHGIGVEMSLRLAAKLPHDMEVNLYRIVQEVFSNIIKHSGAGFVRLDLSSSTVSSTVTLAISDDGKGLDSDTLSGRRALSGIANMRHRAESMRGRISLKSDGMGTEITVTIPISGMEQ
jgi:PAS domain S-box-containing protein